VASALPYDDMYLPKLRMAMRIGGEYRVEHIGARHWRRFAADNGLDPDATLARIDRLASRVPAGLAEAIEDRAVNMLNSELPARLVDRITSRVRRCREILAREDEQQS
jgi:serine/threonine-protein kinase HipA